MGFGSKRGYGMGEEAEMAREGGNGEREKYLRWAGLHVILFCYKILSFITLS